jgi:hypothetical protein
MIRRHQPSVVERRAWRRDLAILSFKIRIDATMSRIGRVRLLTPDEVMLIKRGRRADLGAALRILDRVPSTPPDPGDEIVERGDVSAARQ